VISSLDSHHIDEIPHEGFPPHCCEGTIGQQKLLCTLMAARTCVAADNTLNISTDLFREFQQVIFRKRTRDLFNNPKADRFLTQVKANEYILFGVGVEYSIKAVALGLIARDRRVTVVTDSCGFWNEGEAEMSFRQMEAKGVTLISADQLAMRRLRRTTRYPVKSDDSSLMGQVVPPVLTRRAASGTVSRHR
jgi:nicotinamidase-related amidase